MQTLTAWPGGTAHLPLGKADKPSGCQVLGVEETPGSQEETRPYRRERHGEGGQVSQLERAECRNGLRSSGCVGSTVFMREKASNEITRLTPLTGRLQILGKRYLSSLSLLLTILCSLYFHVIHIHTEEF